jgi:membrane protein DedA with SNARE-associated domain/rhodanese-related sulfurtransferase
VPTLVVAGALCAEGSLLVGPVFGAAFLGCAIGASAWFAAGRAYGNRVMKVLCSISLSPDSCVRQAEYHFERWGGLMLPAAKFLPGLSTVGPPLAGAMRLSWPAFLAWNSAGAALWCGLCVGTGWLFHAQVNMLLKWLEDFGIAAVGIIAALFAAYIALKWWERVRFFKMLRLARITTTQLKDLMERKDKAVVVDVRSPATRKIDPRFIPGALALDESDVLAQLTHLPRDTELVFYCTCPNEATAAVVAKKLIEAGYKRVRPLLGGLDAWADAGHEVEIRHA